MLLTFRFKLRDCCIVLPCWMFHVTVYLSTIAGTTEDSWVWGRIGREIQRRNHKLSKYRAWKWSGNNRRGREEITTKSYQTFEGSMKKDFPSSVMETSMYVLFSLNHQELSSCISSSNFFSPLWWQEKDKHKDLLVAGAGVCLRINWCYLPLLSICYSGDKI